MFRMAFGMVGSLSLTEFWNIVESRRMRRKFDEFWHTRPKGLPLLFQAASSHKVTKEMIFGTGNRVSPSRSNIPMNPKPVALTNVSLPIRNPKSAIRNPKPPLQTPRDPFEKITTYDDPP